MKTIFKLILSICICCSISNYSFAQGFFESFTSSSIESAWFVGNDSHFSIENGHLAVQMGGTEKCRGDIKYNNIANNNAVSPDYYFTLTPTTDRIFAIKFIGQRPHGALKFEMRYLSDDPENNGWLNSKWTGGNPSSITTQTGNYIYYFDLTADDKYANADALTIDIFNIIIADAEVAPYKYSVDWIGVFESLEELELFKDTKDDGEDDKDEVIEFPAGLFDSFSSSDGLGDIWFIGNNSTSFIADGHLICEMGDQGTSYRGDIKYNNQSGNVAVSAKNYFNLTPGIHNYLAIKFIGERPHGALKLEMRTADGVWFNNSWAWQSGNPAFISTDTGNHLYYIDLLADENYKEYSAPMTIDIFNIIIADAKEEPYNYVVDWIGTFESVEAIEEFKNFKDDGEDDKDEEITGVIIDDEIINITTLAAGQLSETTQLILSGDWLEEHFKLLEATLGNNEVITSIDMSLISISNNDFLSGIKNPNCLKFVAEASSYPENWTNVIVGGNSENISLRDGYPYHSPKEFVATAITYTRQYATEGWASLCLPFDIDVSELPAGVAVYEFVKAEETAITFNEVEEGRLTANTPYIANISDIENAKVFAVDQDITVPSTNIIGLTKGNYIFKGSFEEIRPAEGLYLLGSDGLGFGVGIASSYVPPFRSYLESVNNSSDAKYLTLGIGDGEATSINLSKYGNKLIVLCFQGELTIIADRTQTIEIYSIDGRLVKKAQVHVGENRINGLSKGIYLLNNQKVVLN